MSRVLIVDDEANLRRILAGALASGGHDVVEAAGVAAARAALGAGVFDVVLTDQRMPDGDGLELIAAARAADPSLPVVMITAYSSVELAVEAMRQGAFDFIPKPFHPDQVLAVVARAAERAELMRENANLRGEAERRRGPALVGRGPAMRRVLELIERVGPTPATVLITGETGTGKELVARALHAASPRAHRPLLAVNCAAFAETLLDSELFGHERGAFTGAERARPGLFEAAHRGTLFLDEAGEMSGALQAKLLRALVSGEVTRVGSVTPRKVDVRLLVATHRDLLARVAEGSFRQDLYYRLAVVPIETPPLRERLDDLPELAERLLDEIAFDLKSERKRIAPDALEKLGRYAFPGNVRELRNLLERASILARGEQLRAEDFPSLRPSASAPEVAGADAVDWAAGLTLPCNLRATLATIEAALVERALASADGVQAEAARTLGISRGDLNYRLRRRHGAARDKPAAS